jgi:hypothetical protein
MQQCLGGLTMKLAFIVHTEYFTEQIMELLDATGIDYFTRWDKAIGKGHGTEPHLGTGGHSSTNCVLMIGFENDEPLERLVAGIQQANTVIKRTDDKIRLFQVPLERLI